MMQNSTKKIFIRGKIGVIAAEQNNMKLKYN